MTQWLEQEIMHNLLVDFFFLEAKHFYAVGLIKLMQKIMVKQTKGSCPKCSDCELRDNTN